MAEALYRKYRPQVFEDVVGQEHIERTIKNAIGQDKVSHAYLFCGPRGTGKTTTARLLAKALLCEQGLTAQPDGTCNNCLSIAKGEHSDVYELDAASRTGVENVREEIIGRVQFAPTQGRYKVYIIDEVHMLSTAAFNALLKTLEEPPSHVVFVLCTTDPQKVPETIHSRCQRFDFHRISPEAIVSRLGAICVAEEVEFEGDALDLIAYRAEGGMRNALTSLEQLIAFGEGKVTLALAERLLGSLESNDMAEIVTAIGKRDIAKCFAWTASYVDTGSDLAQFVRDLSQHVRNMYVLSLAGNDVPLEVSEAVRREMINEMQYFNQDRLARLLGVLGDVSAELKTSSNPRLSFEIALTRMIRPDSDLTLESLAERIEALESGHSAVAHVVSTSTPVQSPVKAEPSVQDPVEEAPARPLQASTEQSVPMPDEQPTAATLKPEPEAVPAVQPGQQPVSGSFDWANPAVLQRTWQSVMTGIKKQKTAHGALFLNTRISFDDAARELVIEFPNSFSYSAVQKPDIIDLVKQLLEQASGAPVRFRFVQRPAEAQVENKAEVAVASPQIKNLVEEPATENSTLSPTPASIEEDTVPLDRYEAEVPASAGAPEEEPLSSQPATLENKGSSDDLDAILTLGFGEGVSLEEISDE